MATESGNPDNKWNACVMAKYSIKDGRSLGVYNRAYEGGPEGTLHEANLCAGTIYCLMLRKERHTGQDRSSTQTGV